MENAAQARTLHTPTFDTFDENPEQWIEWPCGCRVAQNTPTVDTWRCRKHKLGNGEADVIEVIRQYVTERANLGWNTWTLEREVVRVTTDLLIAASDPMIIGIALAVCRRFDEDRHVKEYVGADAQNELVARLKRHLATYGEQLAAAFSS